MSLGVEVNSNSIFNFRTEKFCVVLERLLLCLKIVYDCTFLKKYITITYKISPTLV